MLIDILFFIKDRYSFDFSEGATQQVIFCFIVLMFKLQYDWCHHKYLQKY